MHNYFKFCFSLLLITIFAGCDLSKYPIDDPAVVKIDTRLLGTWSEHKGDLSETYTLTKKDDFYYTVTEKNKKEKPKKYIAYLSEVEHTRFLNVYCKDEKDSTDGYLFIKIIDLNVAKKTATAVSIKDSTMKYLTSTAQVRERITTNLNNPTFYGDTAYMYKVK